MAKQKYFYNPNRSPDWNYGGKKWKLSRSKIDLFIECPRCFYIDNKLGTKRPSIPSFNLNIAVDELFKKEFDYYRSRQEPHPIMKEATLDAVPFMHKDLDIWRDPFVGITYRHETTDLLVSGGVDDVWQKSDGSLQVVDYKATSKDGRIDSLADSAWEEQYIRQIGVYQWLFAKNNFAVDDTGYFVYANAKKDVPEFSNTLTFETTLIPCQGSTDWIESTLVDIKQCLEANNFPASGEHCEYCAYREAAGKKLYVIHQQQKQK